MPIMKLKIDDGVKTISDAFSFARYVHCLAKNENHKDEGTGALWFRGQADEKWELKPSIGRSVKEGGLYDVYNWTVTKDLVKRLQVDWDTLVEGLRVKYLEKPINSGEIPNQEKVTINKETITIHLNGFSPEFEKTPKNNCRIEEYILKEMFGEDGGCRILKILQEDHAHKNNFYKQFYDQEKNLLQRFRRDVYPIVERMLTDWEAITLGQHHRLPTRLLDWTSNPLVALFNAVNEKEDKDGTIFAYRPRRDAQYHLSMFKGQNPRNPEAEVLNPLFLEKCDPNEKNTITIPYIKGLFPMLITNRLIAQSGGFTIQDPLTCLIKMNGKEFKETSLDVWKIYRWQVPSDYKYRILDQLHRVSINTKTLFPDLDGIGHGLWQQEKFRKSPTQRLP